MTIVLMKLTTGDEVIAEQDKDQEATDTYRRVRVLQVMQQHNGQMGAALIPFLLGAPEEILPIDACHIMTKIEAPSEIAKMYLQQTSGIEIASSI